MDIYHYTSITYYGGIKSGSWQSRETPGLGACKRVCTVNFDDEGATNGAVFGLLDPEPECWTENSEYPLAWKFLMQHIGSLLLVYEPSDELIDESYVIDWSHMEHHFGGHKEDLGNEPERSKPGRRDAERKYWGSRIPMADILSEPAVANDAILPEVITMDNIPFDLIRIAETQPRLGVLSQFQKNRLQQSIKIHPELEALEQYSY